MPIVVCWRTRAHDSAARIFSIAFFEALRVTNDFRRAFAEAEGAVRNVTKPGTLAGGIASGVAKFDLRDPDVPAPAGTTTAAAGIPVLISA